MDILTVILILMKGIALETAPGNNASGHARLVFMERIPLQHLYSR